MLAVGTSNGFAVLEKSADSWQVVRQALDGCRVEAVGRVGSSILAATEQGVYESDDEGATWKATLDDVDVRSLAVAIDGTVFAGADKAVLYRRRPADEQFTEVLSFKELPTYWTWTFPGSPHLPNIRAITVSPTNPKRVYVGVEVGGVMVSEDGGETWREARESMPSRHPRLGRGARRSGPRLRRHRRRLLPHHRRSPIVAVPLRRLRAPVHHRHRERPYRA